MRAKNCTAVYGLCLLLAAISQFQPASSAQGAASISDGIYSEDQAARGAEQYRARCASCHSNDLRGNSNSPSLLGMSFMFVWEGRSLGELYDKMRREMPTDQPGSLPEQAYADVLAFILASNEFPAGTAELAPDQAVLEQIIISSQ
jgi:mono/diheme cytochrome c family protein